MKQLLTSLQKFGNSELVKHDLPSKINGKSLRDSGERDDIPRSSKLGQHIKMELD